MNGDDRNSLASTDRGCPLCQNTRPCSYLKPELLEPPDDTLFHDDDEASSSSSSSFSQHHNGTCGGHPPCSSSHHNHHHDNCNSNHNHNNQTTNNNNNNNTTNYKNNNSDNNNPRFRPHHNQQWQAMFEQLRQFQQAHGHCNVPSRSPDHPALAGWVKRQRHQYARLSNTNTSNTSNTSTLTPDRIAALNALGLVWNVRDATWMERYAELVQFRQHHGHVRVPSHHPANQVLAAWVKAQRHSMHVQPQAMPAWRKAKLDALGFEWRILSTGKSKQEESSAVVPMEMDE